MLGTIRFCLAFWVVNSHFPGNGMKLNLGVVSVICFYFISGYLMQRSYVRFLAHSQRPALDFYIDRGIKLFPQYSVVVVLTLVCILCFGKSEVMGLLAQDVTLEKGVLNLLLLPVNYVFEPLSIHALSPHPVIPPAWSLATEFHFYLLLPFIFGLSRRGWVLLLGVALTIQFSSFFFASGVFNSNNFGYRYIFGVLTVFLYGYAFARRDDPFYKRVTLLIWGVFALFLMGVGPALGIWQHPQVQEVLLGGVVALPLGYYFTTLTVSEGYRRVDSVLGDLAYPIFISHFLSFYLMEKLFSFHVGPPVVFYIASVTMCLLMAFGLTLMQKQVEVYRIKRRGFRSLKATRYPDL